MTNINTVTLSGIVADPIRKSKTKGALVARFFLEVQGTEGPRSLGKFEIIASGEWAEMAQHLSKGDHVVLVGYLQQRQDKAEIHVKKLIPLISEEEIDNDDMEDLEEVEIENEEEVVD